MSGQRFRFMCYRWDEAQKRPAARMRGGPVLNLKRREFMAFGGTYFREKLSDHGKAN